jgi:hypothetical protein
LIENERKTKGGGRRIMKNEGGEKERKEDERGGIRIREV